LPFFTLQLKPSGPIAEILVNVSDGLRDALMADGKPVPFPVKIDGLIDTGADCTCADPQVFRDLNLTRKGTCALWTPSTGEAAKEADEFDVDIKILGSGADQVFPMGTIAVAAADVAPFGFQIIIGRDVLAKCLFSYNGQSRFFTLAY
jgi:predicted aspartyl protease